jgi:hypothetical protein
MSSDVIRWNCPPLTVRSESWKFTDPLGEAGETAELR